MRAERVRKLLDRAKRYRGMLDSGEVKSMRELGRAEGNSGARVCQIVGVLDLPREILVRVDVAVEDIPVGVSVTRLREIAACRERGEQRELFQALVGESARVNHLPPWN